MSTWLLDDIHSAIQHDLNINEWLMEHNLFSAQPAIIKHGVTLNELSLYTQDEIDEFIELIGLSKIEAIRFKKGIKSLQLTFIPTPMDDNKHENESSHSHSASQQIVAVFVSQEEQNIYNEIKSQYNIINDKLLEIQQNIQSLDNMNKENKIKINNIRTEMIKKLNQRFNELISQSEYQITQKQKQLNIYKNDLKKHEQELFKAKTQYNFLLIDENMTIQQRKKQILSMKNNILPKDINYSNSIVPKVKVSINKNIIFKYIDNIGNIRNYAVPNPPIFLLKNITPNNVTVQCQNVNDTTDVIVEMKDIYNDDMKWIETECTMTDVNEYTIVNLRESNKYCLRVKYKNRYGFSKYSETQNFKTKKIGLLIDSKSNILGISEKKILCDLLNEKQNFVFKKLKCIFSSVNDGFNVKLCHKKCQNQSNILFIIHTCDNNIFGGFTKTIWKTDNNIDQKDINSFIFLLNCSLNNEYLPKCFNIICDESMAVWYHSNYFCLMGTGYDISIYKTCNKSNGYTYVSKGNYDMPTKYYINGDKKSFTVKHIEIFSCA